MKIFRQFDGMCGPACLESAFFELDERNESQLRNYTQSKIAKLMFPRKRNFRKVISLNGCDPEDIVPVAIYLGFKAHYRYPTSLDFLQEERKQDRVAIVNFTAPMYNNGEHYCIFLGLEGSNILLGDPKIGGIRKMNLNDFLRNWKENTEEFPRNRPAREKEAIIISRNL